MDGRTTQHPGYRQSQRWRRRVEEVFGWIKTVGAGGKLRFLGQARNKLWFEVTAAAYNLTRLTNIEVAAA
ncbi:MAG: transposase [Chloroflexi bacterium]|nr:transposase [Chloroflexota bacterium]